MIKIYHNNEIPKGYQETLNMNGIRVNDVKFIVAPEYHGLDNCKEIADKLGKYKAIPTIMDYYIYAVF